MPVCVNVIINTCARNYCFVSAKELRNNKGLLQLLLLLLFQVVFRINLNSCHEINVKILMFLIKILLYSFYTLDIRNALISKSSFITQCAYKKI